HADPPQAGAVVPLVTVAQFFNWSKEDPSKTVGQKALERMQDPNSPMPPPFFNNAVTPDELQAFQAWSQANFVGGCYGSAPPSATCTTCHGDDTRVGIAGADTNIKVCPPKGTNGEVAPSTRAVGAHQ